MTRLLAFRSPRLSRRSVLALALAASTAARAQPASIPLGVLTSLSGAGEYDGSRMLHAMQAVGAEINAAGGVLGSPVEFVVEDDETNPESAVRAARKLIDVDRVPVIMGTWASAVTMAVAPLCWESKTFLMTVSSADGVTQLPHQGYLIRTQANTYLQGGAHAAFIAGTGARRVYLMSIQSPLAVPTQTRLKEVLAQHGSELVGALIYQADKTSYRSEVDQALRERPDLIYLNGYSPDVTVLLRELYQAGFEGPRFAQSYAVTQKVLDALPAAVTEKIYTVQPSADVDSPAYALATQRLGVAPDSVEAQATDWVSLVALTIAKAKAVTGTGLRDNIRKISQGNGTKVYSAVEGLKLLAAGHEINYEGASGPCEFNDIGDIKECKFRFEIVSEGKFELITVQ